MHRAQFAALEDEDAKEETRELEPIPNPLPRGPLLYRGLGRAPSGSGTGRGLAAIHEEPSLGSEGSAVESPARIEARAATVAGMEAAATAVQRADKRAREQLKKQLLPHERLALDREERTRRRWETTVRAWDRVRQRAARPAARGAGR